MAQDDLVELLSELAHTLATDFSIEHILDGLVDRIPEVLPGMAAGVTLIDSALSPRYVAASSALAREFELVQSELGEGPCVQAYLTGDAVLVPDLSLDEHFPGFAAAAREAGLAAVFAFPLRHGDAQIGALDLYRLTPGDLSREDLAVAQILADVTTAYLLNAQARDEVRRVAEHFQHTSLHDPLTGLPNRVLLHERLEHAARRATRTRAHVAVLFLDVDKFKQVNDAYGHDVGDQLLVAVTERLSRLVRPGDTLARLSGDEFVFLCEDVGDLADAEHLALRLGAAFVQPFHVDHRELAVTASIGLAYAANSDETSSELLSLADAAMYEAKRRGGGSFVTDVAGLRSLVTDRVTLGADLLAALAADQLDLAYLPVVRIDDGAVCGVEALIRWDRGGRGPVASQVIVETAEHEGLSSRMGLWVLERVCTDAVRRRRQLPGVLPDVAMNVSTSQLLGPGFCGAVQHVLAATDMDAAHLVLEVTESAAIQDPARAASVLADLHALGVRTALDDFGSGASSLSFLRTLPVDIVKLDRSFVTDVTTATGRAMVTAVSDLAHLLGMQVTAEGVETPAQRDALTALGCDQAQGFLFAEPMSADALTSILGTAPVGTLRLPLPQRV